MSALPPMLADAGRRVIRQRLGSWLKRGTAGAGGGALAFALLALVGPLGDSPAPPPSPQGMHFTDDQLAAARAAWKLHGRREALQDVLTAISTNGVTATRAAVQHLLEESP